MDQSQSNNKMTSKVVSAIPLPKRSFTVEFLVGIFTLAMVAAAGYLAVGLGGVKIFGSSSYDVNAEFDNVSGLKNGAEVEVGGVSVGQVADIKLKDPQAIVVLRLNNNFKLRDDDIASVRTKGIIGDRYVKISRGASETYIGAGGTMTETESVVDIEDIIGKIVHSLTGDDDKKEEEKK